MKVKITVFEGKSYIIAKKNVQALFRNKRKYKCANYMQIIRKLCSWVLTHLGDEVMSKISTKIVLKSQQKNLKVNLPSEGAAACSFSVSEEK